ncbi:MAG: DUF1648 domain-containing protein [Dermatophilaceae bacterium]|nr:DUF1648 domain-containing protein [Dermatophilaceae bacterium]
MTTPAVTSASAGADRRPTHALVASALVGPLLTVAGLLLTYAVHDRLPASLALHWGPDGRPDRFASLTEAVVTASLMTALLPMLFVVIGAAWHPSARGPLAGFSGAVAVFLGGLLFGSLTSQRPGLVARVFPTVWLVPTLVLAVAVGVALWRWGHLPPPALDGAPRHLRTGALRLDVPDTTRLAWTGHAALPGVGILLVVLLAVTPLVVVAVLGVPWLLLLAVAIAALLVLTGSARVAVDADGLRVTSLFLTWSRVPLERVAEARTGTVSPLREFGGYGWRIGKDGSRGFVTRSGEALVVERVGEPPVVVTVDDAAEAAAVLNTLASRRS